jgi:hypothetical protein
MTKLTQRDKRILRLAALAIGAYLVIFYGVRGLMALESGRSEYQQLKVEAQNLQTKVQRQRNKAVQLEKYKKKMDLNGLSQATLVVQVSSAIQKAAQSEGVKLGPIREVAGNASAKELAAMQLEAVGPLPATMTLLHRLETLGFPLVVDSLQVDADSKQPGNVKLNLRVVVLDSKRWLAKEGSNAKA